ncbi:quinol dehydrogenase ferredoxin subunit NapH [Cribrihabitans pelagius]|uniref:quinol dehydrogenase ferredoxin subunit NapH n=1 Tax=Cribrihabitans pelagius TaxID=1765746 RepID=UPI003B5CFA16
MSARPRHAAGQEAIAAKGWVKAHKWLLLRRLSQAVLLALFLILSWAGWRIVDSTIAGSRTLDVLPLTDPLITLQSLLAGHAPELTVLAGAVIVLAAYALIGGRVYCSWVCPINPVTGAAHWLHTRLGPPKGWQPRRHTRLWLLGTVLAVPALTGAIAWETVNPVTMLHPGLVFGMGGAWGLIAAVFLFDLLAARRGWCGHLCPVGAFYGLLGQKPLLRVSAANRAACTDCMGCFAVCPGMHVIPPALRGEGDDTPLILSPDCTNCGRCIDVCSVDVFRFTHRNDRAVAASGASAKAAAGETAS